MKLEKAIEILTLQAKSPTTPEAIDFNLSLILGIEALKREKECRINAPREEFLLLPGETED